MQDAAVPFQQEMIVTVTRKGQITIPVAARKHMQTNGQRKLALTIDSEGGLQLRAPKYPTIESLAGAAGSLPDHLKGHSWKEIEAIAHEDLAEQLISKYK